MQWLRSIYCLKHVRKQISISLYVPLKLNIERLVFTERGGQGGGRQGERGGRKEKGGERKEKKGGRKEIKGENEEAKKYIFFFF